MTHDYFNKCKIFNFTEWFSGCFLTRHDAGCYIIIYLINYNTAGCKRCMAFVALKHEALRFMPEN